MLGKKYGMFLKELKKWVNKMYAPDFDEWDLHALGDFIGYNPNELSPFEIQYLEEYSARDVEEELFYQQGEPI